MKIKIKETIKCKNKIEYPIIPLLPKVKLLVPCQLTGAFADSRIG